ncbi:hypothetical protein EYF80_015346 [Liparis tanakae]|uniref:Uncharacterized protein n=1 Tax=Liparis tanakae TaxID=230148 RepID=A0A4Z2I8S9_9TELE|nr:hypothetical protein EYF80_015346 [Liparis tanakae]
MRVPRGDARIAPLLSVRTTEISERGGSSSHRIPACIPDGPNLEGHPEFTFSETPALPKETESMRLKLLAGHKGGVISPSLSLSVHSTVC